ncbi:MAG: hypothetical protein CV045_12545 [Cyanobacteria bacterium M5B4]|nr:hypothetical protein [Cyanobacteria bacterium KgW148]PLS67626.1 MAG: hypothetical protein CV045_12545 [Cyanobacteria bacterium M5B4]
MNTPLVIGALIVAVVVVFWLINVIKTTIQTALLIGVVVFALQLGFKVGPIDVWRQIQRMAGGLAQWLRLTNSKYTPKRDVPENLLWLIPSVLEAIGEMEIG